MIYSEDILFRLPDDRELQFPAMSALQRYVNDYQMKMDAQFHYMRPGGKPEIHFRYAVECASEDWDFFQLLGIELCQPPEEIGPPDVVIDMNAERILSFKVPGSYKHAAQICSAMAGVEGPPFPKFKACEMDWSMQRILSTERLPGCEFCDEQDALLMFTSRAQIGGFVGKQGWLSYMFASLGFPVVEILSKDRSETWLSKWMNPFYRVIEEGMVGRLLQPTLENLKKVVAWQYERNQVAALNGMPKDSSKSFVQTVANISEPLLAKSAQE